MCGGVRNDNGQTLVNIAAEKAIRAQQEQERIAREREALAAQQQAQMAALQQKSLEQATAQKEQTAQLQAEQAQRLGGIRSRGTAVSQSLQILANAGQQQAPTAAVAPKKGQPASARATTASLRMGATASGSGSGPNFAA